MISKNIDILIPTFNREKDLNKNLKILTDIIISNNLSDSINIIVSDNNSEDKTEDILKHYSNTFNWIFYFKQEENIGLEKNAVFCL